MPSLLQLVHENPADDGARRSYADWLIEQGDVRGELIALQLARASKGMSHAAERREVELLFKHGREWLGKHAKRIRDYRFERGFLASCTVTSLTKSMVGDPLWSTVERLGLDLGDGPLAAAFVTHPVLRSLRDLRGVGPLTFAELQKPGRGAGLRVLQVDSTARVPLERAKAFGGLQQLERLTFE
ncbi:MAG: TIGR02996 domain-containing protein [Myxococcaceae bacterium]|nr:TIGR02996 domain-containing protein [Myxococcaceae bacterium]